jgi:hypothetical protein
VENRVEGLAGRANTKGPKFGNAGFNSVGDSLAWITTHLPNGEFGLFVAFVSIFFFMGTTQVEMYTLVRAMNNMQRVKLNRLCNSKVLTSFQNVLPDLLGNSENATYALPKLSKHEKWEDLRNGAGMYGSLPELMQSAEEQLRMAIQTCLHKMTARTLAVSLLEHSVWIVSEWRRYINTT